MAPLSGRIAGGDFGLRTYAADCTMFGYVLGLLTVLYNGPIEAVDKVPEILVDRPMGLLVIGRGACLEAYVSRWLCSALLFAPSSVNGREGLRVINGAIRNVMTAVFGYLVPSALNRI